MNLLSIPQHLNFRQNDKKVKQKVASENIVIPSKSIIGQKCQSVQGHSRDGQKKKSIATSTTSRSKGKQGRLLLRDYLYLTNKNSEQLKNCEKSRDKKEIRKQKYKLDEQKVFNLMQEQMKTQLNEVIQRLQKMKENFQNKSLKNENKNNNQNIALIYSIRSFIRDKFKKGIQDINMILFQEQQRQFSLQNPIDKNFSDQLKSDNFFNGKIMKKKQHKISLQIQKDLTYRQNAIPINGNKFLADFV